MATGTMKVKMCAVQSMPQYQARAESRLNEEAVEEYAERYREGSPMDPIQVCGAMHLGFFVVDGHHRFEAMKRAGIGIMDEIEVDVVDERTLPAVVRWCAAGSNTAHGIRRTQADKRKAVVMVLTDYPEASDLDVARHCGVSRGLVWKMRKELGQPEEGQDKATPPVPTRRTPPPPATQRAPEQANQNGNDANGETTATGESVHMNISAPAGEKEESAEERSTPPVPTRTPPKPETPLTKDRDLKNRHIPSDLQEFWKRREELMQAKKHLRAIEAAMRKGIMENDPLWCDADQATLEQLSNVIRTVEDCEPYYVCPACSGTSPGCQLCAHRGGFIGRIQYETLVKGNPTLMKYMERASEEAPQDDVPKEDEKEPAAEE